VSASAMPTLVIQLFKFILGSTIRLIFFPLKDVEKENLYLRYQLVVLKREIKNPPINRDGSIHSILNLKVFFKMEKSCPHRQTRNDFEMASQARS
jgi:hypothetical protein